MDLSYLHVGRHRLVALSALGVGPGDGADQLRAALGSVRATLGEIGLGLEHVVRSRLWAQDAESRSTASPVRLEVFTGPARSASSSYVCPSHLPQDSLVAIDVVARVPEPGERALKAVVERDPVEVPIHYLTVDDLVVFAGLTHVAPSLEEQVEAIAATLRTHLAGLGSTPASVTQLDCYVHRGEDPRDLAAAMARHLPEVAAYRVELVDGYSSPGKLLEVEVTALLR